MDRCQEIERSIIKKYRKSIWNPFCGALQDYDLIQPGDRIAVCLSGGKDSMLLAKCMQELHRHSRIPFEVVYVGMDPGYLPQNRQLFEDNAQLLHVPVKIFESRIFDVVDAVDEGSPCYLCARMRRGNLYAFAKECGCNKIALGHHFNDVIETVLMSMTYSAEIKTMLPKLHSSHFPGMELIRPLYKVKEEAIVSWARYNDLRFLQCACHFTEADSHHEGLSKRREIKELIASIKRVNPQVDDNLFRSLHNVNLAQIVAYRDRDAGQLHSFLEQYNDLT